MADLHPTFGITDRASVRGSAARWSLAAAIVTVAHVAIGWSLLNRTSPETIGEPPPAVMIELASVAPDALPEEIAPGPPMMEAQPAPVEETSDAPVEPVEKQEIVAEAPRDIKELPKALEPEAVLSPAAPPKPQPDKKPKKQQVAERTTPLNPDRPRSSQTSAPAAVRAARAERAAAPSAGVSLAPSVSAASWRASVMAHLNRYKRFPSGATSGTASVGFTINGTGQVLSSRLSGSSGDGALDQEAVAMIRRASPVPAPPAEMGQVVSLAVPIRFSR